MLQAFTLLDHTKLESELNTVHNTLCYCLFPSVLFTKAGATFYTIRSPARQQRAPIDQIREPGLCADPQPSRQVSILAGAATIVK
jgi:hypothetical protein